MYIGWLFVGAMAEELALFLMVYIELVGSVWGNMLALLYQYFGR